MKIILICLLSLSLFGCASITGDSSQLLRIETITPEGQAVAGAECKLTNDFSTTSGKSGGSVQVHRSSKDLDINCSTPGKDEASGRAISRANAGMAGNIIFGGGIGAIIDHNKGTAYTYPTWIRLVFGQTRTYDRREETEGTVLMGKLSDASAISAMAAQRTGASQSSDNVAAGQPALMATGYARIDDIDAIPYLSNKGRDTYREWLKKSTPRAFAIAAKGSLGGAWGTGLSKDHPEWPADVSQRALFICEANAHMPCKLYAVNGAVVWPKDIGLPQERLETQSIVAPPETPVTTATIVPSTAAIQK